MYTKKRRVTIMLYVKLSEEDYQQRGDLIAHMSNIPSRALGVKGMLSLRPELICFGNGVYMRSIWWSIKDITPNEELGALLIVLCRSDEKTKTMTKEVMWLVSEIIKKRPELVYYEDPLSGYTGALWASIKDKTDLTQFLLDKMQPKR
jgi:hypothetical protein